MKDLQLTGLVAAAYTPMHQDYSIAPEKIGELVDYSVRHGLNGLFVNGTTGEFPSLTDEERKLCAREYIASAAGRIPIIVNIASCSIQQSLELSADAVKAGADALCLMMPFYFKPDTPQDFAKFFQAAAAASDDLPVYLYHAPGIVPNPYPLPASLEAICQLVPNFAGVKFTNPDIYTFRKCMDLFPQLQFMYGKDEMLLGALAMGAKGGIGTTYNYLPRVYRGMWDAFHAGDLERARKFMQITYKAVDVAARHGIPALKLFMKYAGIDVGPMRMPCNVISAEEEAVFAREIRECGLEEWLG